MATECSASEMRFQRAGAREVIGKFNGGNITSDGGALLLREVERQSRIIEQFARCFVDYRDPALIEHTVRELVAQRVYALALGYEDLNDHDDLRRDPLLAVAVGKTDVTGQERVRRRDEGKALAGKSTLNRLELTAEKVGPEERYKKIEMKAEVVDRFFVAVFIQSQAEAPPRLVLDLDATDDTIHGNQEGRFYHGYYRSYCYLPLYIFCDEHLLCARLRRSNIDASEGAVEELDRIVAQLRGAWPEVEIVIRGDSGFAREELMAWCEAHGVGYVLGLARNARLESAIEAEVAQAEQLYQETKSAARVFKDFRYQTRDSWSRERRVVGKAEYLEKGPNPRFVVTSIPSEKTDARELYEQEYCARGEMENRIKEQQLDLFADRTSAETMRANQLRLWFSSVGYVLMHRLRCLGLKGTQMARAQCQTIRLKLLKIGAQVRVTVRKVWIALATGYPYEALFMRAYENLQEAPSLTG